MKKKDLLNEVMGVPRQISPWVSSFTKLIIDVITEETNNGADWDEEGGFDYKGQDYKAFKMFPISIDGDIVMNHIIETNGYANDPKAFLNSEMFKGLPLWNPTINLTALGVPDEVYKQEKSPMDAEISVNPSQKLSRIGKTTVFPNVMFGFDVVIPYDNFNNSNFITELKTTISHELLHAYQKYKQLEGGHESHFKQETILNVLSGNQFFQELSLNWWKEFLHLVYLHLSFEINARVTQTYHYLKDKDINSTEEFLDILKQTTAWQEMETLESFNAEEYIDKFELPKIGMSVGDLSSLNPLEALSNLMHRTELAQKGIDVKSEEGAMKSLIKIWEAILQLGLEHLRDTKGVDINMLPVPESAKEDTYIFFKFFEKRFHKKAKAWKRKLYRLGSLLIRNEEDTLQ
jgi:hypothetical protein